MICCIKMLNRGHHESTYAWLSIKERLLDKQTWYASQTYLTILQTNKTFVSENQNEGKTKVASIYRIPIIPWRRQDVFLNFQLVINGFAIMGSVISQSNQPPACIKRVPMQHISLISRSALTLRYRSLMTWCVEVNSFYMCIRAVY